MKKLVRFCGIWGIADSLWLVTNPPAWGRFWERVIGVISNTRALATACAFIQVLICVWLLQKSRN